jgi:hypothetical protein
MKTALEVLAELVAAQDAVDGLGEGTVGGRSEEELAANMMARLDYEEPITQRLVDAWATAREVLARKQEPVGRVDGPNSAIPYNHFTRLVDVGSLPVGALLYLGDTP